MAGRREIGSQTNNRQDKLICLYLGGNEVKHRQNIDNGD